MSLWPAIVGWIWSFREATCSIRGIDLKSYSFLQMVHCLFVPPE